MTPALRGFLFAAATSLLAPLAQADILWLQRDNEHIKVLAGELNAPTALPALRDAQPVSPKDGQMALETASDHYTFAANESDSRFTALRVGDDGVLTYFQARYGRQETKAVNDLELVPTQAGGNTFQLYFKGRPVSASLVNVDTASGWHKSLKPGKDGTVTLDTPISGLYVLEVSARVNNGNVTVDGKKYEDVRYTATLSFEVTGH
ncbi:hypothetical protein [Thauera linaloolentis]|uniref:DUF4198 domain-containing protein n=1 Tax=Thauera linaloolentis (strain DSM 12138 / JCM 21573 / CCUG 41526 / CIP 105981 / IAM 15112 / NBRC 102519 / 47Lol) TaxID=1123367 RepID=N6YVA0_THAL4|nr:hypothetical protein [Thauera linaloolentis]ENO86337.1 hypothetical protein C666_13345 [Thauera linaloolentis 47Lol = DSM 12138]MCM8565038.1 DUF4198 domain-containing protein [Thauera linaloolentis]